MPPKNAPTKLNYKCLVLDMPPDIPVDEPFGKAWTEKGNAKFAGNMQFPSEVPVKGKMMMIRFERSGDAPLTINKVINSSTAIVRSLAQGSRLHAATVTPEGGIVMKAEVDVSYGPGMVAHEFFILVHIDPCMVLREVPGSNTVYLKYLETPIISEEGNCYWTVVQVVSKAAQIGAFNPEHSSEPEQKPLPLTNRERNLIPALPFGANKLRPTTSRAPLEERRAIREAQQFPITREPLFLESGKGMKFPKPNPSLKSLALVFTNPVGRMYLWLWNERQVAVVQPWDFSGVDLAVGKLVECEYIHKRKYRCTDTAFKITRITSADGLLDSIVGLRTVKYGFDTHCELLLEVDFSDVQAEFQIEERNETYQVVSCALKEMVPWVISEVKKNEPGPSTAQQPGKKKAWCRIHWRLVPASLIANAATKAGKSVAWVWLVKEIV